MARPAGRPATSCRRRRSTPRRTTSVHDPGHGEAPRRCSTTPAGRSGADGVREKDGRKLSILYQTSTNSVRQAAQALIKQWWEEIGVEIELRNIDAGVFFGGDPGSPDTFQKFYADVEMYANNFDGTDPEKLSRRLALRPGAAPGETSGRAATSLALLRPRRTTRSMAELGKTAGAEERAEISVKAERPDRQLARPSSASSTAAGSRPHSNDAGRRDHEHLGQRALERRRLVPREVSRAEPGRGPSAARTSASRGASGDAPLHDPAAAVRDPDAPRHQLHHLRAARPRRRAIRRPNLPLTIPPEVREQIRISLGLGEPFHVRYLLWLQQFFVNEPLNLFEDMTGIELRRGAAGSASSAGRPASPVVDLIVAAAAADAVGGRHSPISSAS